MMCHEMEKALDLKLRDMPAQVSRQAGPGVRWPGIQRGPSLVWTLVGKNVPSLERCPVFRGCRIR
jgi:hypothetical protein